MRQGQALARDHHHHHQQQQSIPPLSTHSGVMHMRHLQCRAVPGLTHTSREPLRMAAPWLLPLPSCPTSIPILALIPRHRPPTLVPLAAAPTAGAPHHERALPPCRPPLTLSIMAASAPAIMVMTKAGLKMGVPHCSGYGTYTHGELCSASMLSVRQDAWRAAEALSYTPDAVRMPAGVTGRGMVWCDEGRRGKALSGAHSAWFQCLRHRSEEQILQHPVTRPTSNAPAQQDAPQQREQLEDAHAAAPPTAAASAPLDRRRQRRRRAAQRRGGGAARCARRQQGALQRGRARQHAAGQRQLHALEHLGQGRVGRRHGEEGVYAGRTRQDDLRGGSGGPPSLTGRKQRLASGPRRAQMPPAWERS